MTKDDEGSDIFDMVDRAISLYEQNKDTIKGVVSGDNSVSINDEDPLKQALVDDDKVLITVDVGTDDLEDIRLAMNGTTVVIGIGQDSLEADVPSDVNMNDAAAQLNNGILEVEIPRTGGED